MIAQQRILERFEPVSDAVRDGGYYAVSDLTEFAVVRWDGACWHFPGGAPVQFNPTHVYVPEQAPKPRSDGFSIEAKLQAGRVTDFEVRHA